MNWRVHDARVVSPLLVAGLIVATTFGAALAGLALSARLPGHHLNTLSRDAIKGVMGLVATMAALLLGLLIHAAQVTNDTVRNQLDNGAASMLELDRSLGAYGPEAGPAQALFRALVRAEVDRLLLPDGVVNVAHLADGFEPAGRAAFIARIDALAPQTEAQRAILARVAALLNTAGRTRILLAERSQDAMPVAFLVMMGFWLTMLFLGFGLLAPRNATVVGAFLIGAVSVSAAMFLIMELNQPFDGLLRVPDTPLRIVLRQMVD